MQIILDLFNFLIELWTRVADGIGIPVPLLSTLFVFGSGAVYALTRSVWKTAERIRQLEEKSADLQAILDNMPGDRTLWGALNKFGYFANCVGGSGSRQLTTGPDVVV